MRYFKKIKSLILIFISLSLLSLTNVTTIDNNANDCLQDTLNTPEQLRVSNTNPHLLETVCGTPIFLNNYTAWLLIKNGNREEIAEFMETCKRHKFNVISTVLLNDPHNTPYRADTSAYGRLPFTIDTDGNPDPLHPDTTAGCNPNIPGEYDFWDHVDYVVSKAATNGLYICLHPTWGNWVSGGYSGPTSSDKIVFNQANAYRYGFWLGKRFGNISNVIWMLGGDRSAVYQTKGGQHDYREVWRAMAEGLADGKSGIYNQDNKADYNNILISFHPRKWAPNSSEWFQNDKWLSFNSIQDTPYDQIVSLPHDYNLTPVKPTWLFEGRYEGATSAWAVRYQAYQTVFAGGFGNTYGSDNWMFPTNSSKLMLLPGVEQMTHLYHVAREIWTDAQFLDRVPDKEMITGNPGDTKGDGMTVGDGDGGPNSKSKGSATSDRITAMRGNNGEWAMVYSANGREISLDLSHLCSCRMDAYWFNPRNGMWWAENNEQKKPTPSITKIQTVKGNRIFNPPGTPEPGNDWVLVLRKHNNRIK